MPMVFRYAVWVASKYLAMRLILRGIAEFALRSGDGGSIRSIAKANAHADGCARQGAESCAIGSGQGPARHGTQEHKDNSGSTCGDDRPYHEGLISDCLLESFAR